MDDNRVRIIVEIVGLLRHCVTGGIAIGIAFFATKSIVAMSNPASTFDLSVSFWFSDRRISAVVCLLPTILSVIYGLRQRRLRRRNEDFRGESQEEE